MDFQKIFLEMMMFFGNWYRNLFSRKLLNVLRKLQTEGKLPAKLFAADTAISVGGAFCNDIVMITEQLFFSVKKIYSIDPEFPPYEKFKKKVTYIKKRVQDVDPVEIKGSSIFIKSSHVLQTFKDDSEKLEVLIGIRDLLEIGEYFILIEEIRRKGFWGYYDRNLHYFYNNKGMRDLLDHIFNQSLDDGYYVKKSIGDYEEIAKKANFEMKWSQLYFRGSFISLFQAVARKEQD